MSEDDEIRMTLRIPASVRDRVAEKAKENGRSLNAEIVKRLETMPSMWPMVFLPKDKLERAKSIPPEDLSEFETSLSVLAARLFDRCFSSDGYYKEMLIKNFDAVVDANEQIDPRKREEIRDDFKQRLDDLFKAYELKDR